MSVRKHDEIVHSGRMINCRMGAMYPNIIIALNVLGTSTEKYKELLDERMKIKHVDKQRSEALKLILNSVYGNLGNKYSLLYNPRALSSVCIYGQIALYDLAKRLSNYAEIVQLNTDGVAFVPFDDNYTNVQKDWEQDFKLRLEEDIFKKLIQRDVNNYIAEFDNGYIKTIGGDVKRYSDDMVFQNNSTRIVDICIVDNLLYNKDVIQTLQERMNEPHLFQYILQAGGTFKGTFDTDGNKYNKVNRVFASTKDGFLLQKKRKDDGLVRFPDAPTKMLLYNDDCMAFEDFRKQVDINHYYQLIMRKLEAWL